MPKDKRQTVEFTKPTPQPIWTKVTIKYPAGLSKHAVVKAVRRAIMGYAA